MSNSSGELRYNPALDGVRGIAVLLVVAFHCQIPGFSAGAFGVDVFFVLSGFLITSLLQAEIDATGAIALGRFYLRRFLRLAPPLAALLLAYLLAASWAFTGESPAAHGRDALLAAAYLSDYAVAFWNVPLYVGHTWSLAVEEHYYLVWPLAVLTLFRLPRDRRIRALAMIVIAATLWRFVNVLLASDWAEVYYRFDTRCSGLALGGLLAVVRRPTRWLDAAAILGATTIALCMAFVSGPAILTWGLLLVEIGSGAIILAAADRGTLCHRLLSWSPLVWLGLISYALYLWHYPIAKALRPYLSWPAMLGVVLGLSIIAASASYLLIERPLREYRRRSRAAAETVSA